MLLFLIRWAAILGLGRFAFMQSSKIRYIVRILILGLGVAIASSVAVVISPVMWLAGYGTSINYILAKVFRFTMEPVLSTKVILEGEEHLQFASKTPCVVISNHQANLDMLSLSAVMRPRVVVLAKSDIKYYPFMGQAMMAAGNVFIQRFDRKKAIETMNNVAVLLKKKNLSLILYPEGTRSHQRDNSLLPFKKGAFHLATQGNLPIIPVVVSSYHPHYDDKNMYFEPGTIRIKVLPPVKTFGMTVEDVEPLMNKCRDMMQETLREISAPPPSDVVSFKKED